MVPVHIIYTDISFLRLFPRKLSPRRNCQKSLSTVSQLLLRLSDSSETYSYRTAWAPPNYNKKKQQQICCKQCTPGQSTSLTCMICTKTKPLEGFAKVWKEKTATFFAPANIVCLMVLLLGSTKKCRESSLLEVHAEIPWRGYLWFGGRFRRLWWPYWNMVRTRSLPPISLCPTILNSTLY